VMCWGIYPEKKKLAVTEHPKVKAII